MTTATAADPVESGILAAGAERVRENAAQVAALTDTAEALARSGDVEGAASTARDAAFWAYQRHAGIHVSPRLEGLLRSIAPVTGGWQPPARRRGRPARVLHVMTQAYLTGGHTRWTDRLIRSDTARSHSLVLTHQQGLPVPAWLRRTIAASGGRVHELSPGTFSDQVVALRSMAFGSDLVVANIHPQDVVAVAALGDVAARPPVAMLNHADHTFWLGIGAADMLVCLRDSGRRLALRRRGADATRVAVMPLPVDQPELLPTRETARRCLGIGDEEVVLLTCGSAWKFDPFGLRGQPSFPEILGPIVAADERLRLYAVGPLPVFPWADAARMTGGRMQALGTRTDLADLQRATDLYLDPFPAGSLYSLLEPAALDIPAIALRQWPDGADVLMADSPGLDGVRPVARDPDEYRAMVEALVADPIARRDAGRALGERVRGIHAGAGWHAGLEAVIEATADAREAVLRDPHELDPALGDPLPDVLARALAVIPESGPVLPERVTVHLPLVLR
jgi:hypothetical protein